MNDRAKELIHTLGLSPHPEGGHYREIHRSPLNVPAIGGGRSALTCIYFLLTAGQKSRWHRLRTADELWHHLEGAPLELFIAEPELTLVERRVLGPLRADSAPQRVVPAGHWQAARTLGEYTLVGCSVGPGFEFSDFQLLSDLPTATAQLRVHLSTTEDLL